MATPKRSSQRLKQKKEIELKVKLLNEDQRKEALKKYRTIYNDVKNIDHDKEEFSDMMKKLYVNIEKQNECLHECGINELITLDAKCMALTSDLSYNLVRKFNTESKFNSKEFVKRLKRRVLKNALKSDIMPNSENNRKIQFFHLYGTGLAYNKYHYQVPAINCGFRPNVNPPTETKERRSQRQTQTSQATQPTQYDSTNNKNIDDSDKRLEYMFSTLKKLEKRNNNAVPMLQASFNPNNFAKTIENMFNIAFLSRQSLIRISNDEGSLEPMVQTINPEDKTQSDDIQSIFTLDFQAYKSLIEKLEITRSVFK